MRSTFAFVRFSNVIEAMTAVDLANGRIMDGFRIKTFLDREANVESMKLKGKGNVVVCEKRVQRKEAGYDKGVDEQSYKEVLMFNEGDRKGEEVHTEPVKGVKTQVKPAKSFGRIIKGSTTGLKVEEPLQFVNMKSDPGWLNQCLVGQIYDPDFIQQVLVAEGFKVKICCWSGYYVVIQLEEIEQVEIFWDLKESMLKSWFTDIDTVENFRKEQKLKVWAIIEGIPVEAWNESTLIDMGSRWGKVIQIESETLERKMLDKARLLLRVRCLSRIPPLCLVEVNGLKEPVETPEIMGKESKSLADINFCGLRGTTVACTSLGDGGPKGEKEQLNREFAGDIRCNMDQDLGLTNYSDRPNGNHLFEVQVEEGAESYSSSGHSVAIEPVLDPVSGLFSVKPRLITRLKNNNLMGRCSSLMNRPCRVGFSPLKGSYPDTVKGVEFHETRPEDKMGKADGGRSPHKFSEEAKASLEICENIGLIFNEKREGIGKVREESCSKKVINHYKLSVLFIQESKLKLVNSRIIGQMCRSYNNFNFNFVASEGSAGGLISMWDSDVFKCDSGLGTRRFIILQGTFRKLDFKCALINVYGPNDVGERTQMFEELAKCIKDLRTPVILGVDFNIIRSKDEKIGVCFNSRAMRDFSDFIESSALVDIPLNGGRFTWSNFRDVPSFSRLDRFLVSAEVLLVWPDLLQCVLPKNRRYYVRRLWMAELVESGGGGQ
ncbi:hypothetical protein GQ457_08G019460 [Hibiscus cannabinus]